MARTNIHYDDNSVEKWSPLIACGSSPIALDHDIWRCFNQRADRPTSWSVDRLWRPQSGAKCNDLSSGRLKVGARVEANFNGGWGRVGGTLGLHPQGGKMALTTSPMMMEIQRRKSAEKWSDCWYEEWPQRVESCQEEAGLKEEWDGETPVRCVRHPPAW